MKQVQNPRNPELKIKQMFRNGSRKMLPRPRDLRVDQNCAPNPMECLPEPKTAIQIKKILKNPENPESPIIFLFLLWGPIGTHRKNWKITKFFGFSGFFAGFSGFFIFYGGFGLREAFHWIRNSILTHPDLSRAREDHSGPISDNFLRILGFFPG